MTADLIELSTEDFARAARSIHVDAADPMATVVGRLPAGLQGSAGMAGSDPAGRDWAASYDRAATATMRASQDVVNACYSLSAMFAQTARNYEAADAASTAGARRAMASAVASVPPVSGLTVFEQLPSAAGGSGGGPGHWGLIADLVGYVWPNGHQDRLHAAASVWRACADDLWQRSEYVAVAAASSIDDHLPEFDDMTTVCSSMYLHVRSVAQAQYALADACDELAHHLDEAHSAIEGELASLVEWTAGIEGVGLLASVFSFGTAEAPTQAIEAARIARTAARVAELIQKFMALARSAAQSIAAVVERADRVAAELAGLRDVRLSAVVVTQVKLMPSALRIQEALATRRIGALAGRFPVLSMTSVQAEKKFKHAAVLGVAAGRGKAGFAEFQQAVTRFLGRSDTRRVIGTYRGRSVILNYNIKSRLVLIQGLDGTFVSAWRLKRMQMLHVVRDRSLGGA
jgi:hypothetical protein